ncbi:MAG: twin-arginine translocase subunit TatB [Thiothrix nivea]|nr:MAG: twin-arginine translocase subunit TatB [Thiothrix nivea]
MFDAGFLEMLLVGVIALLVIGPERLPGIAAKVGRFVGKTRAFVANTRSDIERELRAEEMRNLLSKQEEEIRELRDIMQDQGKGLRQELEEARDQLQFSGQQVKDSIGEITRSFKEKPQK